MLFLSTKKTFNKPVVQYSFHDHTRTQEIEAKIANSGGWTLQSDGYPKGYDRSSSPIILLELEGEKFEVMDGSHRVSLLIKKKYQQIPHCIVIKTERITTENKFQVFSFLNRFSRKAEHSSQVFLKILSHNFLKLSSCVKR